MGRVEVGGRTRRLDEQQLVSTKEQRGGPWGILDVIDIRVELKIPDT